MVFSAAIVLGTVILMLPIARAGAGSAPFLTALFTSTSAICVTGLIVQDTPVYWSSFGQWVILLLFQVGGFGIMSAATLLGLLVGRGFRLSDRLRTRVERSHFDLHDARSVLRLILLVTIVVEGTLALLLTLRLHFGHGYDWADAAWHGIFHAVSAFNNAGFSTFSDSLMGFQNDWLFLVPVMLAIVLSSLGFPVLHEIRNRRDGPGPWTLHSKITVLGTGMLLIVGFLAVLMAEWSNPATLGAMPLGDKILNGAFQSVTTRTTGFNALDIGALQEETLLVTYILMFIGGGSAGTAGGIKVTTFFLLGIVVWSEARGERDAAIFGRRIGPAIERQALTVVLLSTALIGVGTLIILSATHLPLQAVLFETISAFATVGLSTGITAQLGPIGQVVLIILMFIGRVGTITISTALAMGMGRTAFRYPEERPIVG
ncbi:trk system potassium uptake protein TrkH [Novosphingobium aromaticivorans]|uniref:TrkH family potassium uptake protein n=1 Tax=Novosphingobium aromaticivorans TaxID=48935 RepID=UPI0008765C77|nr:potassium transporter TrkG [Novosphingobium aromaticivorans]SCY15831.1 trk system potassium uptake protein TrkH [Novosphingobium aromaticivorans]